MGLVGKTIHISILVCLTEHVFRYHCNRFNENDAKAARDAQAKSRAALERYLFYCNRYINHLKSKHMEHKLYEIAEQKMQELQALDMTWIEVDYLWLHHDLKLNATGSIYEESSGCFVSV